MEEGEYLERESLGVYFHGEEGEKRERERPGFSDEEEAKIMGYNKTKDDPTVVGLPTH